MKKCAPPKAKVNSIRLTRPERGHLSVPMSADTMGADT